ncbi:MAG TPA: heparinase II/III family protein [Planctomycetota bacterium]|nr:heparinase II/III family protein [Planctomycetota bacterium]
MKIASGHPRLWIAPGQLAEFRRAAAGYRRPYRDLLLKFLEPMITDVATVRRVMHENPDHFALALGQAWQITRDERYPRAALWLLEGLWTYPTETRHDYDVWGVTAETAALLYDWMHDYWTATGNLERVAGGTAFCARQALDYFLDLYIVDDWHNYGLGLQAGALAGALALGHEFPAIESGVRLRTMHAIHFTGFPYARTRLQDIYPTPATRMCLDEHFRSFNNAGFYGHQEATGGYHHVDSYEFVKMAEYWTSALQQAAGKKTRLIWPDVEQVGEALLQFQRPDLCNVAWGDSRPYPGRLSGIPIMLYHLNKRRPGSSHPVFAEYLRAFGRPRHLSRATHALLCATPEIVRAHFHGASPASLKPIDRSAFEAWPASTWLNPLAVLRSGWDKDATYVTFRVGRHGGGHNHFDHNSFTIFRGGPLAVDSGWVDYTHRSRTEYSIRSLAHNTLLVRNPREKYWIGRHAVPTQNDGGQRLATYSYTPPNADTGNPHAILTEERRARFHDEFDMGTLLTHDFQERFDYLAGDATRAYTYPWSGLGSNPSRRVEEYVRQLVFLKPDLIVIFDRVESSRADFEKIWLLHTQGDPVAFTKKGRLKPRPGVHSLPAGATVQTEYQHGRLTLWPLLPAAQSLRAIGGVGYETWIEHPAPPDPAGGVNFEPPGASHEAGRWRIELRPRVQEKRQCFLTVLHAGLQREAPARNRFNFAVRETGSAVELTIRDANHTVPTKPTALRFSKRRAVEFSLAQPGHSATFRDPAPQRVPKRRK